MESALEIGLETEEFANRAANDEDELDLHDEPLGLELEMESHTETLDVQSGDMQPLEGARRRPTLVEERFVLLGIVVVAAVVLTMFGGALGLFFLRETFEGDSVDAPTNSTELKHTNRTVVLVSVDALRWQYLQEPALASSRSTLDALVQEGAAARMQPVFPSSTFPNHYSIVTGLYPESHGIVANHIYDPSTDSYYNVGDEQAMNDPSWYEAEALWTTIQAQGKRSGTMFWPGSTVTGMEPTYTVPYDQSIPYTDRVNQVLAWLDLPASQRPSFVTLYLEGVDTAGHNGGVSASSISGALAEVDEALGQLVAGLQARSATVQDVNLIIVSDHGMTDVSDSQEILLDDYIDLEEDCEVLGWGAYASIYPKNGRAAQLLYQLQDAPHVSVYGKEDIPNRYHYQNNDRIPDVLAVADEGWCITSTARSASKCQGGNHGYDNDLDSMAAVLIAHGEYFQQGYTAPSAVSNLDVYSLIARCLGCTANP
eukprot:CAMPEP_0114619180 /NCGR_PEP_ID=MMETSP0168-20121206/8083_1 /TAXON_ID=95228 ORGANISM="Vannella sp., Strain DIVA3 517/6/12" /NCGR_SAMPLE_ID=MMETSP0168 /ASSEMBLY_ACC=CAM_ASM_000044 /LENGTH=483 /DNA_ID=CAMNT_0001830345 /DNA_START=18 /DNA_END=1466 /DNA_ORIENTATION=+